MNDSPEDQDKTLLRSPIAKPVVSQKTTKTLQIPQHLNAAEMRQFLGSAFFNRRAKLILQVESSSRPLTFSPAPLMILGRIDREDVDLPCLNLSPFGAREQGMSRKHALLHRDEFTLSIQDTDSKNGTYVNGNRLAEGEMQILRDRDELILGNLRVRVAFQYGSDE